MIKLLFNRFTDFYLRIFHKNNIFNFKLYNENLL